MSEYKSHHYVTKAYLKRWTHPIPWQTNGQKLWMKSLKTNNIVEVPYEKQCQKDNFYKIPEDFSFEDKKTLEKHWFSYSDDSFPKAMDSSLDQGKVPADYKDLGAIVLFVIWQSFRTPKFKNETEKKINELKKKNPSLPQDEIDFNLQIPYLVVKAFVPFKDELIPEFIFSPSGKWFITSDNPSSLWLNTWNSKIYQPTLLGLDFKTRNLEILCPLNPQCCIILHLNQIKSNKEYLGINRHCKPEEVDRINQSIIIAADKTIYSFDKNTLEIL